MISMMQFEDLGSARKGEGRNSYDSIRFTDRRFFSAQHLRRPISGRHRPVRPAAISASSRRCASFMGRAGGTGDKARTGLVSGFGMINYDRGLASAGRAILAGESGMTERLTNPRARTRLPARRCRCCRICPQPPQGARA